MGGMDHASCSGRGDMAGDPADSDKQILFGRPTRSPGQDGVCLEVRALRQHLLQFLTNLYEQRVGRARVASVGQRQQGKGMNVHDLAKLGQLVQGGVFQVAFQ